MPSKPHFVHFPEMALTLVRRVTSKLPYGHFVFRTDPKWTKLEIKEYLHKVYGVNVAKITTSISLGKIRRAPGKRNLLYKLKNYKRVYVRIDDGKLALKEASNISTRTAELR